jgi:nitroreductase
MTNESKIALDLLRSRRSIRAFADRPLEEDVLKTIVETGCYAPSAMNRQMWHFTVLTKREEMDRLADLTKEALGLDEGYCFYRPAAFVILSNEEENAMGRDDCACALQTIFLAAHALGVGSVWINQLRHVCDEAKVRDLLTAYGVPTTHKVYGCAALGYPAAEPRDKTLLAGRITYQ